MSELLGPLIRASSLMKSYGRIKVLNGLNIEVESKEIAVIHGVNGSGKTTLQMIISTLVSVDSGLVEICGLDVSTARCRELIGFVAHTPFLYGPLTVIENLSFFSKLYPRNKSLIDTDRFQNLVGVLGLDVKLNQRVETLSHGFRKRVSIARALINEPRILLLDEPESGLDQETTNIFQEILLNFVSIGGSVLLTTHDMSLDLGRNVSYYTMRKGELS